MHSRTPNASRELADVLVLSPSGSLPLQKVKTFSGYKPLRRPAKAHSSQPSSNTSVNLAGLEPPFSLSGMTRRTVIRTPSFVPWHISLPCAINQKNCRGANASTICQNDTGTTALHVQGPIVVVIDAPDECGDFISRQTLLAFLAQELAKLPAAFRFLITSRAESDIAEALKVQPNVAQIELSITTGSNAENIHMLLRNEMDIIWWRYRIYNLASDWPGKSAIQDLTFDWFIHRSRQILFGKVTIYRSDLMSS
jgi:hypothetical protein